MYGRGKKSPFLPESVNNYCRKYTVGHWRSWRRACGCPERRPWPCGDCAGVLAAPAGVVVIGVDGTVLRARRGGVSRVLQAGVLLRSRPGPRSRVVPMPIEGSAVGRVRGKYEELAAQW